MGERAFMLDEEASLDEMKRELKPSKCELVAAHNVMDGDRLKSILVVHYERRNRQKGVLQAAKV